MAGKQYRCVLQIARTSVIGSVCSSRARIPSADHLLRPTAIPFNDPGLASVNSGVTRLAIFVSLAVALPSLAADAGLPRLLKGVERRYNRAKTLKVAFSEYYTQGGSRRMENGALLLRKPGRMRWDYANPAGKLFISDGKSVYLYSPATNRVDKMKLKETEDMRAPLAFLLGRLEFSRDFKDFQGRPEGPDTVVTATPISDKLPYSRVSFTVSPGFEIRRLAVTGQDQSILEFEFSGETLNVPVDDKVFRFQPPKGAEVVDSSD
jgi:outer membrane lipoprotein carrier protein